MEHPYDGEVVTDAMSEKSRCAGAPDAGMGEVNGQTEWGSGRRNLLWYLDSDFTSLPWLWLEFPKGIFVLLFEIHAVC